MFPSVNSNLLALQPNFALFIWNIPYILSGSGTLFSNRSYYDIMFRTYVFLDSEFTANISVNFPFFRNCKILVFKIIFCELIPRINVFLLIWNNIDFKFTVDRLDNLSEQPSCDRKLTFRIFITLSFSFNSSRRKFIFLLRVEIWSLRLCINSSRCPCPFFNTSWVLKHVSDSSDNLLSSYCYSFPRITFVSIQNSPVF